MIGADACEPASIVYFLFIGAFVVIGAVTGWLSGQFVRRRDGSGLPYSGRGFALGCLVPFALGAVLTLFFVSLLYGRCELLAWGVLPLGALAPLWLVPAIGFAAYLWSTFRSGSR